MKIENYIKFHGKSFYWAGRFLEKEVFDDCSILYSFCRVVDNLVDTKSNSKNNIKKFIRDYKRKNSKNLVTKKFKIIEAKYKNMKVKLIRGIFQDGKVIPRGEIVEGDVNFCESLILNYKAEKIEDVSEKKVVEKIEVPKNKKKVKQI